jgi:hypothetical protein
MRIGEVVGVWVFVGTVDVSSASVAPEFVLFLLAANLRYEVLIVSAKYYS